jgi:hypothetical protein
VAIRRQHVRTYRAGLGEIDMRCTTVLLIILSCSLFGQLEPVTSGSSYFLPNNFSVAPGQLITLIVQGITLNSNSDTQIVRAPAGANLPTALGGLSVVYGQSGSWPAPILEVHPFWTCPEGEVLFRITCGSLVALTIQIPLEAQSQFPYQPGIAGDKLRSSKTGRCHSYGSSLSQTSSTSSRAATRS